MADQGLKTSISAFKGDKNYLELAVREMKAMTKGGAMLSGHNSDKSNVEAAKTF